MLGRAEFLFWLKEAAERHFPEWKIQKEMGIIAGQYFVPHGKA